MTREQAASYLLRAVDDPGALDGAARAALRAHIATCDRCQQPCGTTIGAQDWAIQRAGRGLARTPVDARLMLNG